MSQMRTVRGAMIGHVPCPVCGHQELVLVMCRAQVRKTTTRIWTDVLSVLPSYCAECHADVPCDRYPELRPDARTAAAIAVAREKLVAA